MAQDYIESLPQSTRLGMMSLGHRQLRNWILSQVGVGSEVHWHLLFGVTTPFRSLNPQSLWQTFLCFCYLLSFSLLFQLLFQPCMPGHVFFNKNAWQKSSHSWLTAYRPLSHPPWQKTWRNISRFRPVELFISKVIYRGLWWSRENPRSPSP